MAKREFKFQRDSDFSGERLRPNELKRLMHEQTITVDWLANSCKVTKPTVRKWLKGEGDPSPMNKERLCLELSRIGSLDAFILKQELFTDESEIEDRAVHQVLSISKTNVSKFADCEVSLANLLAKAKGINNRDAISDVGVDLDTIEACLEACILMIKLGRIHLGLLSTTEQLVIEFKNLGKEWGGIASIGAIALTAILALSNT